MGLWTQLRMSSSNIMPHGAVIARNLPQSGMSLVPTTRIMPILSLPNLMPLQMKLRVLRLEDIQLSSSIQKITKPVSTTAERENSRTSRTGLPRTHQLSRDQQEVLSQALSSENER